MECQTSSSMDIEEDSYIGISVSTDLEWNSVLNYYKRALEDCEVYPFGWYFIHNINNKNVIFYFTNSRKVNSAAANQYMICEFNLKKIILIGTCGGIDENLKLLDIIIPYQAVQYDCTVREINPLIKASTIVNMNLNNLDFDYKTGVIGTADKAVVVWDDFMLLRENEIDVADTESGSVAQVCRQNNIECIIIKGISDFPISGEVNTIKYNNKTNNIFNFKMLSLFHKKPIYTKSDLVELEIQQQVRYIENTPKVMKIILDDYLGKVV